MPDDFTAAEIRRLLGLLNVERQIEGVAASMYVVGGAAIALADSADRRTKDVDAIVVPTDEVLKAAGWSQMPKVSRSDGSARRWPHLFRPRPDEGGGHADMLWCQRLGGLLWPE